MTLSDKITKHCMGTPVVCTKIIKDVKDFIKKLKEDCYRKITSKTAILNFHRLIDELAGEELCK